MLSILLFSQDLFLDGLANCAIPAGGALYILVPIGGYKDEIDLKIFALIKIVSLLLTVLFPPRAWQSKVHFGFGGRIAREDKDVFITLNVAGAWASSGIGEDFTISLGFEGNF